ncbi:MAG: hypothetical protein WD851_05795 [Pirellulales bacterium]
MRTQRTLWLLAVVAALTGCRSNTGTGWTVWNPFSAWGKETAVANAEPTLPSQKIAAATKSAAPAAAGIVSASPTVATATAAPKYTPPAAVARTAAATSTTPNYSPVATSAAPVYAAPTARPSTPAIPASNSLVSGTSAAAPNSTGPYNPNGYQPAAPVAAAETTAGANRYGMADRYASNTPATASAAPSGTPVDAATPGYSTGDRYATYETPANAAPAATPTAPQQVAPASATVNLANPPGYYRPAGTSSYPATGTEQVNVASLPEKPASTPPVNAAPAEAVSPYPSTGAPAPGSVYGAPSYR